MGYRPALSPDNCPSIAVSSFPSPPISILPSPYDAPNPTLDLRDLPLHPVRVHGHGARPGLPLGLPKKRRERLQKVLPAAPARQDRLLRRPYSYAHIIITVYSVSR